MKLHPRRLNLKQNICVILGFVGGEDDDLRCCLIVL
jgi:hypothetical protein